MFLCPSFGLAVVRCVSLREFELLGELSGCRSRVIGWLGYGGTDVLWLYGGLITGDISQCRVQPDTTSFQFAQNARNFLSTATKSDDNTDQSSSVIKYALDLLRPFVLQNMITKKSVMLWGQF